MHFSSLFWSSTTGWARAFLIPALLCAVALATTACQGCEDPGGSVDNNQPSANNNDTTAPNNDTGTSNNQTSAPSQCKDLDQDGYKAGPNCPQADDCDDGNASANPGAEETCGDRVDNDCDGIVDETCPCQPGELRLCSTAGDPAEFGPETVCEPGVQRCERGQWSETCQGEIGPREEACNNLDDDCDGEIDEDLRNPLGLCIDELPEDYEPPPEDCGPTGEGDGLDNDGDGSVDEGCSCALPDGAPGSAGGRTGQPCYAGPPATLGVGECTGGTRDCADGTWGSCQGSVVPVAEICDDDLDNDCDGVVDDGCSSCVPSGEETCNGEDDDCDGLIDEGVRNACGGCGEVADNEVCGDGLDNDCNGRVDEGCGCPVIEQDCYIGPPEAAGVGACEMGTQTCQSESFGRCTGSVLPQLERCGPDGAGDGVDNDCDGQTDETCGCAEGDTRPCGSGTGVCEYGTQTCTQGVWGGCQGGQGPGEDAEISCDGEDNDCDGLTDEGLLNACGLCNQPCYTEGFDPTQDGSTDEGVELIGADDEDNPRGIPGLSLGKKTTFPAFLWAANSNTDGVSKVDTNTDEEVGRYWVASNPSRTAVDLDGNMWVIGRNDGRVTKIMWNESDCFDRNNNGTIETSRRVAGAVTVVNNANDPLADECVAHSQVLNPAHPSGRGVAVTPNGQIWFGFSDGDINTAGGVQALDPYTFQTTPSYPPTDIPIWTQDNSGTYTPSGDTGNLGRVYGLISDSSGDIWAGSVWDGQALARFDPQAREWKEMYPIPGCRRTYGIAVDGQDRIWLGCWSPSQAVAAVFDPATKTSRTFYMPSSPYDAGNPPASGATLPVTYDPNQAQSVRTSALGVEPNTGDIWITHNDGSGVISRLRYDANNPDAATFTIVRATINDNDNTTIPEASGRNMRGVGFDSNGFAWHLGMSSEYAIKIDPTTNTRINTVAMPGAGGHYTYSDFTGSSLFSFTAPRGVWRHIFDTMFAGSTVHSISLEAEVPPETTLGVRIRALDANGNPTGDWLPAPVNGATYLDYPQGAQSHTFDLGPVGGPLLGRQFELELRFTTSDRDVRPIVYDVELGWQRP